ncbi:MAG TPA: hypothetical protein VD815_08150 [Candidatus Saccharimonadales bacterium]|nr:hypothetical protein [Candidatus Saccharimonadales bacterium]
MESPFESCGNEAAAHAGNSDAEEESDQVQGGSNGVHSVSPEFDILNTRNL